MNTQQERRVVEALQALTGGLTVTEPDIITANNRLRDNLEPPSPRRKLVAAAIVAAAAALATLFIFQAIDDDDDKSSSTITNEPEPTPAEVLTAALDPDTFGIRPADAGPAPTLGQLAGAWVLRPDLGSSLPMLVVGNGDHFVGTPQRFVASTLSGRTWTRKTTLEPGCPKSIASTVGLTGNGSLILQTADPSCSPSDGLEVWDPVTPGSPVATYFLATAEDANWETSMEPTVTEGFYVAPKTGHVLLVTVNGGQTSYRYFESLADDASAADHGDIFFEPEALAADCVGGTFSGRLESAMLPGVEGLLFSTTALRFSADNDQCATSDIAEDDVWVLLAEHLSR